MRRISCFILLLAFASASTTAIPAQTHEIESPAANGSLAPSLTRLDESRLVMTWLESEEGGHALKFSVLEGDGFGPVRVIARGDDWFANWADTPALFVLPGGDWVAHWLEKSGESTYAYDVRTVRSSDGGQSWSEALSPHRDGTRTEHGFVSYYAESESSVGMVWLDGRRMAEGAGHGEGGAMTLRTARLDRDGLSASTLLDERVCDCCQTASAMTADGPVVVYRDRSEDEIRDHYVLRRSGEGWSEPERLHADNWRIGGCPVNGPALVAEGRRLAVAWFTMPEGVPRVRLATSADSGRTFDLVDNLGEGTALGRVDLALAEQGFVLSWVDEVDRSGMLELAGYDWGGQRLWQQRIEGIDAGRASGFPRLGVVGGCRPVVAWTGRVGDSRRVRVARLDAPEGCGDAGRLDHPESSP